MGTVLDGRYDVLEEIGAGAFARTFRGRDRRLGRVVAIKVLRPAYAVDPAYVQRFEREARAAAAVAHANVVDIYDVGHQDDLLYLVMQFVAGEDLKQLIAREGPLPQRRAADLALHILAGLTAIHEAGIIHRDIKPQNVLVGRDGVARVADFGIARLTVESGLTTVGTVVGTASYMAPEQAEGGPLSEPTDLYSVGVVLYEMLTGKLPFETPTVLALMLAHLHTPPLPPSVRAPAQRISPGLETVVMRALAKRPADRFPDAPAMAHALTGALERAPHGTKGARPENAPVMRAAASWSATTTWPPAMVGAPARTPSSAQARGATGRPRWIWLVALLLLLLAGGAGAGMFYRNLGDDHDNAPDGDQRMVADLIWSPVSQAGATEAPPPASTIPTEAATAPPTATHAPSPTVRPTDPPTPTVIPTDPPAPTATEPPEAAPSEPVQAIVPRSVDTLSTQEALDALPADPDLAAGEEGDTAANGGQPTTITTTFNAADWQGAYFQQTGNLQPWSAVYAQSTGYGVGEVRFSLEGAPATETFTLSVEGMTSENWFDLPIAILVNGQEVYRGTSPFPTWNGVDGQQPWTTISFELPTSDLGPGENTITFVNLIEEGAFSRPPYILLASGTITVTIRLAD